MQEKEEKKQKEQGISQKKQRRVWPGNSVIKYDSDSSGGGVAWGEAAAS